MAVNESLKLRIEQLGKAIETLAEALECEPNRMNKDATIQRFEYTFELSWKTMQLLVRDRGVEVYTPRDSIRAAGQIELIEELEEWMEFLKARNQAAHVYDEAMADEVYGEAKRFLEAVKLLQEKLVKQGVEEVKNRG